MYCASCDKKFDGNLEFCEFCGTKNPFYGMRCRICNKVINYQKGLRICYSCINKGNLKSVNLGEENGIKESYGIHYKYTWRSSEDFEGLEFSVDSASNLPGNPLQSCHIFRSKPATISA